ncbi:MULTISPECIES: DUF3515 family protein [unclassified Leucobacter]|uniref:DUF3515 family protein n=1 Tax=unclassified Leucobacter TaxID=2621730 RepID=UPI001F136631|nr:DUF3515 family protein [Leucobacter sp. CX169]
MLNRRALAPALIIATAAVAVLTGCAGDVPMEPAANANDPACADVIVRLPETIGELPLRHTNAQATGAWGDPAAVLLKCGIEPSGPTTDQCVSVDGIDWIIDRSREPLFRFEAYGREPGLEVIVDSEKVSGTTVVTELSAVAQLLPQTRQCSAVTDNDDIPGNPE